jgi:hypothetical protein
MYMWRPKNCDGKSVNSWWQILELLCEISGSYSSDYEDNNFGMTEAVHTSETSVDFYKTTQHNIPEGCNFSLELLFIYT